MNLCCNRIGYGVGIVLTGVLLTGVLINVGSAQQGSVVLVADQFRPQANQVQNVRQKPRDSQNQTETAPIVIDNKTREALLGFVQQHHSELIRLLKSLEKNRPRQFEAAMRSLSNSYNRLQLLKEQGKSRQYDDALEQWKLNSRIKLKAAQVAVKDTPQHRKQLESLIAEQYDNRIEVWRSEETRLRERLQRLSELVEKQSDRQLEIERNMVAVLRSASRNLQRAKSDQVADSDKASDRKSVKQPREEKNKKPVRDKNKKSDKGNDDRSNEK